ncbi:MAG: hypothetical protein KDB71_15535 [Mycobacterium sp.]|nr:hypothetical protein [Mycobacterium sp.]
MTETTTTPEAETNLEPAQEPDQAEQPTGNREAKYRVERNSARQERDELIARIEQLHQREAERIASRGLAEPADLFSVGGVTVSDLMSDGEVDPSKVDAVVRNLVGSRPGLAKHSPAVDPTQGLHGGGGKPSPTFSDLLRP